MKKEKQKQGVIDKQDLTIIENSEAYELKEKLIEYRLENKKQNLKNKEDI